MALFDGSTARRACKPSNEASLGWHEAMRQKEEAMLVRDMVIYDAHDRNEHRISDLDLRLSGL